MAPARNRESPGYLGSPTRTSGSATGWFRPQGTQTWGWRIGRCCLGWGGATASWTCWKWWGWTGQCAPVQAGTRDYVLPTRVR